MLALRRARSATVWATLLVSKARAVGKYGRKLRSSSRKLINITHNSTQATSNPALFSPKNIIMNAVVNTFTSAFHASGALPCAFGPGADVHRGIPFEAGKAVKSGVPTNYANCRKGELQAECAARGLTDNGIVPDIVNRLVRSGWLLAILPPPH